MKYLNPFDLLDIQLTSLSQLDSLLIKKSKKKILAEIELSDTESITINKIEFSKSEVLNSFDHFESNNKVEFFYFLYNYKELNNFLYFGETKFFIHFRQEYIFKSPDFIELLSPYYAPKFNNLLLKALKKKSVKALNILKSVPLLVSAKHSDKAYQAAYTYLLQKIKWLA
ncbi:MAG: hypothetical protein AB7W47_02795 [Calditrichaceae bacterium]